MNTSTPARHHTQAGLQPAPLPAPHAAPDDDSAPACGWYESSFALRQGLAVSELADSDGAVAALWFAALDSGRLQ